jgi:hypothetical protein
MRRATAVIGALALVVASASVFAQKASFAGKWVLVPPADAPAGGGGGGGGRGGGRGGGGFGQEFSIEQTDKAITIVRTGQDGAVTKQAYTIGGDTKVSMPARGGGAPTEVVTKTAWEGNTLVMTTATANGERKQVLSMEGGNLIVTVTNPGREGGAPTTNKVTYKKG